MALTRWRNHLDIRQAICKLQQYLYIECFGSTRIATSRQLYPRNAGFQICAPLLQYQLQS
jgi:hypothetical protein